MEQILDTPEFVRTIAQLSNETGRSIPELREEAREDLKEMAVKPGGVSVAAWDRFTRWLSRAYKVDYRPEEVEHLRELNRTSGLIFLPNHRSDLDPLVLRWALEKHGFPPNNTLGGSNLALWPMSEIGRRTGIVFIRREFRNAPVYRAMLGVYLAHLVQEGADLEWYIEGGRTRTGKLRPPRMGILSYLLDAFASSGAEDITFVPVAIVYDQQHEVGAIAEEESGGSKAPESVQWALRYARAQGSRRGKVHVRFAEPISLRETLDQLRAAGAKADVRQAVPKVAFEVCHRINGVTPVTASALVALTLLDIDDRALTEAQMRRAVLPMAEYLRDRRIPTATGWTGTRGS